MTEILEPPYTIPFIQRYLGVRRRDKASIESSGTSPSVILTDTDAATEDDGPTGSFQVVAANGNTAMMVAIDGGAMYFSMRDLDGEMRWRLKDGTGLNTRMTLTAAGLLEAVAFKGPLTGNVTGNVSGTALTVTQAAQSAITSLGTLTSATITGDLIVDTSTLKVDSSNDRVGIGTASPGSKLEVYHNAASEHVAVFDQDHATGEGVKITGDMAGAQAMLLIESVDSVTTPNAPEIFRINANGMIGMGTASPADKIHMVTTTGDCLLRTYNQVSGLLVGSSSPGAIVQTTGAVPLSLGTAGVDRMTITSAGVGIGIGTPAYKLDVDGDINYTGGSSIYYDTADAANSVAFRIDAGNQDVSIFRVSTDSWSTAVDYGATLKYMGTRTGNNNSLSIFMDNQIGTPVEAMTILQDGKVGIGTTTPQTQLQVRSAAAGSAGVQEALRVQGTWGAAGDGPLIRFTNYHSGGDNPNALEYNLGGIQGVDFGANWGGGLSFQTPPSGDAGGGTLVERMVVREDGNVGIGDSTPTRLLDVGGSIAAQSTGTYPVVIGVGNPSANPNGANVGVGSQTLTAVTSSDNVAIGYYALRNCTTAGWQVAVGNYALGSMTTQSGHPNYAQYSTAVGHEALWGNVHGAGGNVAVGFRAGKGATTGIQNTFVGMQSNQGASTGSNNTCLGYNSATTGSTTSNEITLGNSAIATLRCQVTSITFLSDERDKTDIEDFDMGLDFVRRLRPVRFVWDMRDEGKVGIKDAGFVAQELQQAQVDEGKTIPNLISDENPDRLEAAPGTLLPALVLAIQELSDKVDALT